MLNYHTKRGLFHSARIAIAAMMVVGMAFAFAGLGGAASLTAISVMPDERLVQYDKTVGYLIDKTGVIVAFLVIAGLVNMVASIAFNKPLWILWSWRAGICMAAFTVAFLGLIIGIGGSLILTVTSQ